MTCKHFVDDMLKKERVLFCTPLNSFKYYYIKVTI